jgi:hypothetical protein
MNRVVVPARQAMAAGRYSNSVTVRFPDPIDCYKIPALAVLRMVSKRRPALSGKSGFNCTVSGKSELFSYVHAS